MIQRIQSVYLLISMVVLSIMFFFPVASIDLRGTDVPVLISHYASGFSMTSTNYWFIIYSALTAVLIAAHGLILFSYKNRKKQLLYCRLSFFLVVSLLVLLLIGLDSMASQIEPSKDIVKNSIVQYEWTIFMPMLSLIFITLAQRSIRKDEALVRSSERLR